MKTETIVTTLGALLCILVVFTIGMYLDMSHANRDLRIELNQVRNRLNATEWERNVYKNKWEGTSDYQAERIVKMPFTHYETIEKSN